MIPAQVGVTLLIMESGMHINFEKVRGGGGRMRGGDRLV